VATHLALFKRRDCSRSPVYARHSPASKRRAAIACNHYRALDFQERAMPRQRQQDAWGPIIPGRRSKRPGPPVELEPREKRIWRDIVQSLPPDWFATSQPVLKELVYHIRIADDLRGDIRRAQATVDEILRMPEPAAKLLVAATKELRAALRTHVLQSQRMSALSTSLRLTPQSRYQASTAKVRSAEETAGIDPWLDWGNDRPQ
jgi:hypothetical protein